MTKQQEDQKLRFDNALLLAESERLKQELADLNRWIQEEAPRIAVEESRKVLERAERAERMAEQWRLAAEEESWPYEWVVATQYKERVEKAEAELAKYKAALSQAEEIAKEVASLLADDHHDPLICAFFVQGPKDVGCFACLAQERLSDITVEALMSKTEKTS